MKGHHGTPLLCTLPACRCDPQQYPSKAKSWNPFLQHFFFGRMAPAGPGRAKKRLKVSCCMGGWLFSAAPGNSVRGLRRWRMGKLKCVEFVFKTGLNHPINVWSCCLFAMIHLFIDFGHVPGAVPGALVRGLHCRGNCKAAFKYLLVALWCWFLPTFFVVVYLSVHRLRWSHWHGTQPLTWSRAATQLANVLTSRYRVKKAVVLHVAGTCSGRQA